MTKQQDAEARRAADAFAALAVACSLASKRRWAESVRHFAESQKRSLPGDMQDAAEKLKTTAEWFARTGGRKPRGNGS